MKKTHAAQYVIGCVIAVFLLFAVQRILGYDQMQKDLDQANIKAEQFQEEIQKKNNEEKIRAEQYTALIVFTLKAMDMAPKTRISDAKKKNTAEKLASYTMKNLPTQESREQYIAMVKNESNFDNNARSPVGAVGIGQIMPGTFAATIKTADIGAQQTDINDEDVNLYIGTFFYNLLLNEHDQNPRLATIAYNGGGTVANKFKQLVDVNKESANYALKTDHVKDSINKSIEDDKKTNTLDKIVIKTE